MLKQAFPQRVEDNRPAKSESLTPVNQKGADKKCVQGYVEGKKDHSKSPHLEQGAQSTVIDGCKGERNARRSSSA